jgi:hypothetical protein
VQFQRSFTAFTTHQSSGFGDARELFGHCTTPSYHKRLLLSSLAVDFVRYSQGKSEAMQPNLMPFWVFLALVLLTEWVWRIVRGDY